MSSRFKATTTTTSAVVVAMATTVTTVLVAVAYSYYTYCKTRPCSTQENITTTTTTSTMAASTFSPQDTLDLIRRRRSIFPKQYSSSDRAAVVDAQVLDDMLEAATWAPSHHLTEPWHFIVFSKDALPALGQFMAEQYKATTTAKAESFVPKKYEKKIRNCIRSSFVIAILCTLQEEDGTTTSSTTTRNPTMEEVCSVAAAVQNMHLMATAHSVGAYWSTSGIYETKTYGKRNVSLENPKALRDFLNLENQNDVCLGWMFVGPYNDNDEKKKWPQGRRKPCRVQTR